MIPSKYKSAHYLCNRFKELSEVEKWFDREEAIYGDDEIFELWQYFKRKCENDILLLSTCSDDVKERERKIVNTANILRYCHDKIQKVLSDKLQTQLAGWV